MKQCPDCGKTDVEDDARFCPNCRYRFVGTPKNSGPAVHSDAVEDRPHDVKTTVNGSSGRPSSFADSRTDKSEKNRESVHSEDRYDCEKNGNSRLDNMFDDRNSPYSDDALKEKINGKTNKIDEKLGRLDEAPQSENNDDAQSSVKFQEIVNYEPDSRDYLKVEFNYNVFAVSGFSSVIQLRLTPLKEELEDVEVYCQLDENGEMKQAELDIAVNKENGENIPVIFKFTKKEAGGYPAKFFFLCKTRNGYNRYMFQEVYTVYDSKVKMQPGNLSFHIENNLDPKHAAEIRNNVINIASQGYTVNQLLDQLRKIPQYGSMRLYVTKREFEKEVVRQQPPISPQPHPTQSTYRILLRLGNFRLFVLGKSSITLGRVKEDNDLQIQIPGTPDNKPPNSFVSGTHGVLEITSGWRIRYMDMGRNGTLLNGYPAPRKCFKDLPEDTKTMMTFGGVGGVELCLTPCMDKQNGNISLVLTHHDNHIRDGYMIVPRSIHLGDVFNGMDGFYLFTHKGFFSLKTPDGMECMLRAGSGVQFENKTITAEEFVQA